MRKLNTYIRFYECCIPIIGYKRAAIYDLQRSQVYFASNELIELIINTKEKTLGEIYTENNFQIGTLKKQLKYLLKNELIFFTLNPENFLELNKTIRKPNIIEFIYLKIDKISPEKINFLSNIDKTGANNLILISSTFIKVDEILKILKSSKIKSINLVGKYDKLNFDKIKKIITNDSRIRRCVFYESKEDINNLEYIKFTIKNLNQIFDNGISSILDLTVNIEAYIESLNFNLFYYQKIFIENNGDIFKFYGDSQILGNVYSDDLLDIVKTNKSLNDFWEVTKDLIEECKICEFRYICPDNRVFIKKNDYKFMHNTPCIYNPKNNKWNEKNIIS